MKEKLIYTAQFWAALDKKLKNYPHYCSVCHREDGKCGPDYEQGVGKPGVLAVVRLALVDTDKSPNDASNVDLFCLRCRKPSADWHKPKKMKPQDLPSLFEASKL